MGGCGIAAANSVAANCHWLSACRAPRQVRERGLCWKYTLNRLELEGITPHADGDGAMVATVTMAAAAADGGSAALRVEEAAAARQRDASMYRAKARGRMFGSPSGAQRTYHEGAHVATSMGIAGAGIMACFEMDKAVHEREPPTERCDANTHTHTHALIRTWATHSWVQTAHDG